MPTPELVYVVLIQDNDHYLEGFGRRTADHRHAPLLPPILPRPVRTTPGPPVTIPAASPPGFHAGLAAGQPPPNLSPENEISPTTGAGLTSGNDQVLGLVMAPPICPVSSLFGPVLAYEYGDGCGRGCA